MTTEIEQTRDRLLSKLRADERALTAYDDYVEGNQPLRFVVPALAEELGDRFMAVTLHWPELVVEANEHRLDIEGFRFPGSAEADDDLWNIWLDNDGDFISQQANQESLSLGRSYIIVGPGDDVDTPLITPESPFDCMHEDDPRTHEVSAGIKRWTDPDGTRWITLYERGGRTTWQRPKRGTAGDWVEDEAVGNDFDLPSIVPLINRPRILGRSNPRRFNHRLGRRDQRLGKAEFHSIMPLADAANKFATDMMTSGEFFIVPRRVAVGFKSEDFEDESGKPLSTWGKAFSDVWATENKDAKVTQLPEADLKNFHESLKMLVDFVQYQVALPADYNPFTGDNPTSADAIRAGEARFVKGVERKQSVLGNRYERVQRLVMLERGMTDDAAKRIETIWRDPATPTVGQRADATVKLTQQGIIPVEQAREDLGYTPEQRKRMADMDRAALEDPYLDHAVRPVSGTGDSTAA